MKKKGILTIIMALTLTLGVVGCGKDDGDSSTATRTTAEKSSDSKKDSDIIEQNEKNLFELGSKQTKDIKKVLETYGVNVCFRADRTAATEVVISKDESDCGDKGCTGYTVSTSTVFKPNDGGDNSYSIIYGSEVDKDGKPIYSYDISIVYPDAQEFKLDNFKMLKDLVKANFGDNYDMASLESWVQEHIRAIEAGEKTISSGRDTGAYREGLMGGEKGSKSKSRGERFLTYRLTLRK